MPRISLPTPEGMSPAQRRVYDAVVSGPRGVVIGPLRAALHSPELAERWQKLGEFLRFQTSLPTRVSELAIIVVARHWNSNVEWSIHSHIAAQSDLDAGVIEALRLGQAPTGIDDDGAMVYEFTRQILQYGQTDDVLYGRVRQRFDEIGIVELTALIGYYTMVAMTLNVHDIPLPDGYGAALPPGAGARLEPLTLLPPLEAGAV